MSLDVIHAQITSQQEEQRLAAWAKVRQGVLKGEDGEPILVRLVTGTLETPRSEAEAWIVATTIRFRCWIPYGADKPEYVEYQRIEVKRCAREGIILPTGFRTGWAWKLVLATLPPLLR